MHSTWQWLLSLLRPFKLRVFLGALCFSAVLLANAGLLADAAILLSRSALVDDILLLMPLVVGVRFFGIARASLRYCERLLNHDIAFRILSALRKKVYDAVVPKAPDRLLMYHAGTIYAKLIEAIDRLQFFYIKGIGLVLAVLLVGFVGIAYLAIFVPRFALVYAMLFFALHILHPLCFFKPTYKLYQRKKVLEEESAKLFFDRLRGGQERSHHQSFFQAFSRREEELIQQHQKLTWQLKALERWQSIGLQWISRMIYLATLGICGWTAIHHTLPAIYISMLGLFVLGSLELAPAMPQTLQEIALSYEAAEGIVPILEKTDHRSFEEDRTKLENTSYISLQNIFFHYHKENALHALHDLTLDIKKGEHIAIIGESGSGKSSVLKLICGLWSPDGGQVLYQGRPLKAWTDKEKHDSFSVLEQNPYFFATTIYENLLLACPDASMERCIEALHWAELSKFAKPGKEGLDYFIGRHGYLLSGGERQRLALARLYLQNTPVVLLDEPTQHLDYATAQSIHEKLKSFLKDKTVIYITHRLEESLWCDFIYFFKHGKIAEQGSPEELLAASSQFSMWLQMEREQF